MSEHADEACEVWEGSVCYIIVYTPTQVFLDALRVVNRAYSRLTLVATSLQEAPVGAAMGCPLSV